jgi:SWI/SNF-related matrix-associated actin-dependent regulator of chromatin subfamily A protein 2/4
MQPGPMQSMPTPFASVASASTGNSSHVPPASSVPAVGAETSDAEGQRYPPGVPAGATQPPAIAVGPPGQKMIVPPGQPGQLPPGAPGAAPSSMQAIITAQQRNNRIAPVAKPQGLDPVSLLEERENRYCSECCPKDFKYINAEVDVIIAFSYCYCLLLNKK